MIPQVPSSELEVSFSRSSGPGGQNVNKTSTKVLVEWKISDSTAFSEEQKERIIAFYHTQVLQATSQETRSQPENRIRAVRKLQEMVRQALLEEKDRVPTKPTFGSRLQRLFKKRLQSKVKNLRKKPGIEE